MDDLQISEMHQSSEKILMKKNEMVYKFLKQTKHYNKHSLLHNLKSDLQHFINRPDFIGEQEKINQVSQEDRKSMIKWLLTVNIFTIYF